MLPLCQMHPSAAVPPPANLNHNLSIDFYPLEAGQDAAHLAGLHARRAPEPRLFRDEGPPRQWSVPIRTSLPQSRSASAVASSPFHRNPPQPEHHLRRKTPNGTIDAGYDGSPTQLFPGPPPLKHMILSVSSGASSYFPPSPFFPSPSSSQGQYGSDWPDLAKTSPWPYDAGPASHWAPRRVPVASSLQYQTYQSPGFYQPLVRPSEHNVRAFCPPPGYMNESIGQLGWQPASSPWNYMGHGQPLVGSSSQYLLPEHMQPSFGHVAGVNDVLPAEYTPRTQMGALSMDFASNGGRATGFAGQPRFKEKALSQAHRSYVDLLAYVQTGRKLSNGKSGTVPSGYQTPSKPLVYPKPPQPTLVTPRPLQEIGNMTLKGANGLYDAANNHQLSSAFMSYPGLPHRGFGNNQPRHAHYAEQTTSLAATAPQRNSQRMSYDIHCFPDPGGRSASTGKASPLANAKSSLEIIDHLCEQSGWKWTEGMLLGGCLHYGLEHYEDALKWFSRIVALDSSHVEAIANMAATLYCLDRQDEAEKHWLKAVKLRPAYLEAAEHLVGLLYKKRGEEAVDIITFVQQALRLSTPRSRPQSHFTSAGGSHVWHPSRPDYELVDSKQVSHGPASIAGSGFEAHDYGSSGYALPGSENGRILALVHAKGTMLYSLKDVKRASEAFEEAVMISVGRRMSGIRDLVRRIQNVLSPTKTAVGSLDVEPPNTLPPLLLAPETARHTARLVFADEGGALPGLTFVADGVPKRAATQTTSNSLLSLAKIFQDAMSTGSADPGLLDRPTGIGDILALYYLSLSLQESPSTANNVGILLAGVQQAVPSSAVKSANSHSRPSIQGITPGSGLDLALAYYHYGLRLDPKHVHLHTNLGSLLKDIGQLDLAIQMYERAVSCDGTFDIALTNLANAVKDRGRINDAITYYRRAVSANPDFAEAVCGLLTALNSVCDWHGRGGVMLDSGRYDRWHVDDEGMFLDSRIQARGSGLTQRVADIVRQQLEEASHWGRNTLHRHAIEVLVRQLQPFYGGAPNELEDRLRKWAGQAWEGSRVVRLIERATRASLRQWYHELYVSSRKASSSRPLRPRLPPSLVVPPAPTVLPFHTFTTPLTARDIRAISQRNAMRISCSTLRSPWLPAAVYPPPPPPNPHLNIGYVSSDFNNHPLAHLMQSVFGLHNVRRARALCYATTASDKSIHRQKIEQEAPVFRDVSSWAPEKLIEQIIKDEIHILVNLNGYTRGARNEVFAARPAPIQMAFMGFAGTLGAEWCDYILADTTTIPPRTLRPWRDNVSVKDVFNDHAEDDEHEWMYSENIIFCRDTFFCCDHAQSGDVKERKMTWEEEERRRWKMRQDLFPNIPDDTIILGNFNQLYKIEPTTFRCWLRVLARVPKAVLWLLRFPELGESNLRKTAEAWAGTEVASRLLFTDVAPKSQHISRARVCDLFLDTPECNAHTTAADVLWSSTPLLTLPRYPFKMCSRMAASILKGALPDSTEGELAAQELIAESETDYEESAIRLAGGLRYRTTRSGYGEGRGRLSEMRRLLWESKWSCGLFNTRRWVDDVETAYEEAWRRWVAGEGGDIYL